MGKDNLAQDIKKKYRGNIEYWGQQLHSKIPEILSETDILLFPSLSDGFGFAAAEGMAAGCPVIASENSGIADLIENGINGFVIPTHSIRHGEKMYETLLTNEECAKAVDLGDFYRVPADNRGLNYDKYFKEGDVKRNKLTEFNSNNTKLLNKEEIKAKMMELTYIQGRLAEE